MSLSHSFFLRIFYVLQSILVSVLKILPVLAVYTTIQTKTRPSGSNELILVWIERINLGVVRYIIILYVTQ